MIISYLISLITLIVMEVALGIDNIIFVTILASKLPEHQQGKARRYWMLFGIIVRISLLAILILLIEELHGSLLKFSIGDLKFDFSGKDFILLAGGIFLIFKSVKEIHEKLEGEEETDVKTLKNNFRDAVIQIVLVDLIFSIDSIITAIGIADNLYIMSIAVVLAMVGMFYFAKPLGDLVIKHPTLKMLALCFLLLIGVLLVAEGFDQHVNKGYIYFAMGFSILVELLNIRSDKNKNEEPVQLKVPGLKDDEINK